MVPCAVGLLGAVNVKVFRAKKRRPIGRKLGRTSFLCPFVAQPSSYHDTATDDSRHRGGAGRGVSSRDFLRQAGQYQRSSKHRFIPFGGDQTYRGYSSNRNGGLARGKIDDEYRVDSPAFARVFQGSAVMPGLTAADLVTLSTDRLALIVDPAFGGRVTSLTDRLTGREWLVQGLRADDVSEGAQYRGAASRGWDECFPTVLSCHNSIWGGRLRDHGMLWGRPWEVVEVGPHHLEARFQSDGITFNRTLTLKDAGLTAAYSVTSARATPVPYLWSQHCVLSPVEGDRISLTGQGQMEATGFGFDWPSHPARDLTQIGPANEGFVLKSYCLTLGQATAQIRGTTGGLRFDWNGTEVPALGLWLDYGGWPNEHPVYQVAIEPTTGAADDLAEAEALGQARLLIPGETQRWTVRLTLTDPEPRDNP